MSLFYFSCLCMFIVFAQQTESLVLILRDYDDEPLVLGHVERSSTEEVKQKIQPISNYKPKRTHSKKSVLQYGRHIYHLDNNADLKDLRSELKPASVSYDYVDIDELFRVRDPTIHGIGDYLKDVIIFSNTPIQICNGAQCDEDLRKNSKHKKDDDTDWKHKKMSFGRMKRFQIVDNRHKSKKHDGSSEERHEKKKRKSTRKNKKKKKRHTTESAESKESGSVETKSHKKSKKIYKPHKKEKISSEESIEIKRKPKKKDKNDDYINASVEKRKIHETDSKSQEDFHKKKKRKKTNYVASDETTRKTFAVDDDNFFMQGNKIYHAKERKSKKKHNDFDRRRRLEHFLPKRYHWESSEIHDLGYFWFNGPKGKYPAPQVLYK